MTNHAPQRFAVLVAAVTAGTSVTLSAVAQLQPAGPPARERPGHRSSMPATSPDVALLADVARRPVASRLVTATKRPEENSR